MLNPSEFSFSKSSSSSMAPCRFQDTRLYSGRVSRPWFRGSRSDSMPLLVSLCGKGVQEVSSNLNLSNLVTSRSPSSWSPRRQSMVDSSEIVINHYPLEKKPDPIDQGNEVHVTVGIQVERDEPYIYFWTWMSSTNWPNELNGGESKQ